MPALRRLARDGLFPLIAGLALLAACTGGNDVPTPEPDPSPTPAPSISLDLVMSNVSRNVVPPAAISSVSEATNAFAADLYIALTTTADRGPGGNLVFSPYSAAVALAMTREGARGQTATEMDAVLRAELAGGAANLGAGFNGLEQALATIPGEFPTADPTSDDTLTLELATANQLFGQQGFTFDQAFLDTLAADYGAGMRLVDYENATEAARKLINDWVGEQTRDRIPELVPQGAVDQDTRLVLTNAIYLNAPWQIAFIEGATQQGAFETLDGREVDAMFMRQTAIYRYGAGDGYQAVELPYVGGRLSMLVVVPDAGTFEAAEAQLSGLQIAAFRDSLRRQNVILSFPRFEFRTQTPLKDVLSGLGMPTAFTDRADFSGITSEASLLISEVLHEAFISVDEEGTEAAAATAVIMNLTSAPAEPPIELTVDRPFLFLIQELETGAILFMGRVTDPTAE